MDGCPNTAPVIAEIWPDRSGFPANLVGMAFATAGDTEAVMMKARIALLALGTVAVMAVNANAATRVVVQIGAPVPVYAPPPVPVYAPPPPAPVVVAAPVRYGYVWRPGHYVWTGYGYRLVPAAYVRPPYA